MNSSSSQSMDETLQVLVSTDGDRAGLEEILGTRYTLTFDEQVGSVDGYLVTSRTLPQYIEALRREKERQNPVFCPIVLVQLPETRTSETFLGSEDGHNLVDDIISAPVDPQLLHRRLENLFARRTQSMTLSQQYERAESWFQGLFNAIPDPAFVIDCDGTLQECNNAFCAVLGFSREDILDTPVTDLPETGAVFDNLSETLRDQRWWAASDVGHEPIIWERDGETRHVLLSAQSTEVEGETYVIAILSDVTELQQKTERLEKLASVLSHDLRNPVNVADLHLTTLRETHPESADMIEASQRAIDRIDKLTEELVTVARTGQNMDLELLRLDEVVEQGWSHVDTQRANFVIEDGEWAFESDKSRLYQLFENLFRNAVEHGDNDVTVWVGGTEEGFYVEDDGSGIPPEDREDIFKLGYSTHSCGNGLGLGIIKEIVKAHNWEITIEEGRSGGARFEVMGVEMV